MTNEKQYSHWLSGKGVSRNRIKFGRHLAYWINNSPRRILHSMSYYKFAAKMIGVDKSILDIGCGEGLGTWLLARECGHAEGIDLDDKAIKQAQINWNDDRIRFYHGNIFDESLCSKTYDAVVSFDIIEHIIPENASSFYSAIVNRLYDVGIAIIGTPNVFAQNYATAITSADQVNLYSEEKLEKELRQYFKHVFIFSANEEVIHTEYYPMSNYLVALACQKTM